MRYDSSEPRKHLNELMTTSAKSRRRCTLLVTDRILRKETSTTTTRQSSQLHELATRTLRGMCLNRLQVWNEDLTIEERDCSTPTTRRIGQCRVGSWQLSQRKDDNEAYKEWKEWQIKLTTRSVVGALLWTTQLPVNTLRQGLLNKQEWHAAAVDETVTNLEP
jgi:hypothetical protein